MSTHIAQRVALVAIAAATLLTADAWAQVAGRTRGPASEASSLVAGARGGPSARYYPDDDYRPGRYRLGVQVRNTENGVLLTSVAPGGFAARNGLEAGDVIVTVGGFQVGYVDRRLYDLGDELDRNVDNSGRVTLLVLRQRDGRLINNYIDFSEPPGGVGPGPGGGPTDRVSLRGEIEARGNPRLSSNAVQVVRILDVTHPAWQSAVVSRSVERGPGQFPLNFGVAFEARPGHRYAVDAIIYDGGRQFQTDRAVIDGPVTRDSRFKLRVDRDIALYDPTNWYRSNLGRAPTGRELSVWREQLEQGYSQDEIEAQVLGGSEFFDRNRSNPAEYARGVTRAAAGREPSPDEVRRLTTQLQQAGANRSSVVEQMLRSLRKQE
jgi:hypothetical protein